MKYTDLVATSLDIKEYYDNHIRPLNPTRYKEFTNKNLAVCPLHNDNDPSMGIIFDKRVKTKQRYHCFGCGASGDIITLHQEILKRTNSKVLTYEDSAKDLATMYNLVFSDEDLSKSNLTWTEQLHLSEKATLDIISSPLLSNRDFTRQFSLLNDLSSRGTLDELKLNLDALNLKLKESKLVQ